MKPIRFEPFWASDIAVLDGRRSLNEDRVESLAESIRRLGLMHPVSVRIEPDPDEPGEKRPVLIAGRHRLAACDRLGILIECAVFEGDRIDAQLWEIAENLHRSELTVQERAEHIAEWIRLTEEKSAQVGPKSKTETNPRGSGRAESGINAATKELGITRQEGQRAVKVAAMAPEAKEEARKAGIQDNQSALLRVAREPDAEKQLAAIRRERDAAEAHRRNRETNRAIALTDAEQFAAWLMERTDPAELPMLIAWIEGCKSRDVTAALRREAA